MASHEMYGLWVLLTMQRHLQKVTFFGTHTEIDREREIKREGKRCVCVWLLWGTFSRSIHKKSISVWVWHDLMVSAPRWQIVHAVNQVGNRWRHKGEASPVPLYRVDVVINVSHPLQGWEVRCWRNLIKNDDDKINCQQIKDRKCFKKSKAKSIWKKK